MSISLIASAKRTEIKIKFSNSDNFLGFLQRNESIHHVCCLGELHGERRPSFIISFNIIVFIYLRAKFPVDILISQ